jgi:pyruvate/2-oxoglutarate/acetoin dehydrogenase E1 component
MAEITFLEAIREGILEEMERDPSVFCLGEDIGKLRRGLQGHRGIAGPLRRGACHRHADQRGGHRRRRAGAAHYGMRPVCEMQFIDFISCGYDILTNYAATARYRAFLPCRSWCAALGWLRSWGAVPLAESRGGFLHTPGLKIVCPATADATRRG